MLEAIFDWNFKISQNLMLFCFQVYLGKYGEESRRGTTYHKCVANGLLGLTTDLPTWFIDSYKVHTRWSFILLVVLVYKYCTNLIL